MRKQNARLSPRGQAPGLNAPEPHVQELGEPNPPRLMGSQAFLHGNADFISRLSTSLKVLTGLLLKQRPRRVVAVPEVSANLAGTRKALLLWIGNSV